MPAIVCKHFRDIEYSVFGKVYSHYTEFKVYPIFEEKSDGSLLWESREEPVVIGTSNIEEAQVFLSGSIKWDGCSNWKFDIQDRVMLHFCRKKEAEDIGTLFKRLYEIVENLMPSYEEFN